jgi:hypothetical protein
MWSADPEPHRLQQRCRAELAGADLRQRTQ